MYTYYLSLQNAGFFTMGHLILCYNIFDAFSDYFSFSVYINLINKMTFDQSGYKVFCGNLTRETDDLDFKDYFEKYGELTDYIVMKTGNSKRNRGFGFVSFKDEEAREKVLADCPHTLNGQEINVQSAEGKERERPPEDLSAKGDPESEIMRKIYVGGLEMETVEEAVRSYFEKYGTIEELTMVKDSGTCS